MKFGIIEITSNGHYNDVDSIVRILTSDSQNEIIIFTNQFGKSKLEYLTNLKSSIKLVVQKQGKSVKKFLNDIGEYKLDRYYIITLVQHLKEVARWNVASPIYLYIHNIDFWFYKGINYHINNLIHAMISLDSFIYRTKIEISHIIWRSKIINKIMENGKFVVVSTNLIPEMTRYIPREKIQIIPGAVFNESISDLSKSNEKLRICIPGAVTQSRRDYCSFLNMLLDNVSLFKDKIEVDLLGGISYKENAQTVISIADNLNREGLKVIYYSDSYVPISTFNENLAKSDLIIGNSVVKPGRSASYGKTKESGLLFLMIRVAKPGIFIKDYPVFEELESSVIKYYNYENLKEILLDLISNREKLLRLKGKAYKNSLKFLPEKVYQKIMEMQ